MKTMHSPPRILLMMCFLTTGLLPQPFYNASPDSANEKPTQYRRTTEPHKNYLSYEEKYRGKDLQQVKTSQFPLTGGGVWTELNPKVPRVDYVGIHFVNQDTGWAVGDLGALIKTTDGGSSWKVIQTNTTAPILKVRSYNGQIVIATGYDGLILRSTDGGDSFVHILSRVGAGFDLWGLELINDTVGWACGATALLKTTDGGENWLRINTPGYSGNLWWIDFLHENYGVIAADGKVLKTTDGGNHWEILQAGDNRPLYSIDIIDSLHIAAAGHGGTNFRGKNIYSSDGGYTWADGAPLTFEAVNDIKYTDRDTGYLVMNEVGFYKTTNRGQSWAHITNAIGEYELALVSHNIGYSAGYSLKIYKAEGSLENWRKLILNEDFADVFFINEYKGFVITSGSQGKLFKTENGGVNWQLAAGAPGGGDILFIDSVTGFIASSNSNIYKTTNGGQSWYPTTGVPNIIAKIHFINPQIGWAAGGFVIIKTTDGGENWVTQFTHAAAHFTSIYFIDSFFGWATITGSRPFKTTDGGQNWVQQTNLDFWESDDVYFNNNLKGWIIAGNEFYRTSDAGINWSLDPQVYTYCKNFETISNSHFIITRTNIYESIDTGQTWQNITSQIGSSFSSLHAPKDYIAYGIGRFGYIVEFLDPSIVPVELSLFKAELINNKVLLYWTTETETNNYGFEILRSTDLVNWQTRGFVPGNGTVSLKNKYIFYDTKSLSDHYYYKLKQIDYDGSFTFSEIAIINFDINSYSLSHNYPNPANPTTSITYSIPQKTIVRINLYSVTGELMKDLVNEEKEKGYYKIEIELNNYASGMYFYRMETNSGYTETKKLIILK